MAVCASVASLAFVGAASAFTTLPTPGTPSQVAALVAASTSIKTLPSDLVPSLASASLDSANLYYPETKHDCLSIKQCVYGDLKSSTVVVLWGDSHAQMWLPALDPLATKMKFKLILLWHSSCPTADVTTPWEICTVFRRSAMAAIAKLHPTMVLMSNKTTNVVGPSGKRISAATWQTGVETTINALKTKVTKIVVVGDIGQFNLEVPECLATYSSEIQKCSVPDPNPNFTQEFAAEKTAAAATGASYVDTHQWLCPTRCSPLIGNMVVYWDQGHLTATYAEYLENVWDITLTKLLSS